MMPVNHVQSRLCHVSVLADADTSTSDRILTAVDLTATSAALYHYTVLCHEVKSFIMQKMAPVTDILFIA